MVMSKTDNPMHADDVCRTCHYFAELKPQEPSVGWCNGWKHYYVNPDDVCSFYIQKPLQ